MEKETVYLAPEVIDEHDIEESYKRISPWDQIIRDHCWWEMATHEDCPAERYGVTEFLILLGPTTSNLLPQIPDKVFCPLCREEAKDAGLIRFPTIPAQFVQKAPDVMFAAPWDICYHRCNDQSLFLAWNRSIDMDAEENMTPARFCPLCKEESEVLATSSISRQIFMMSQQQGAS